MEDRKKLEKLIEGYFKKEDIHSPTSATAIGIHKYDGELEDFSQSGIQKMKNTLQEDEKALENINYENLDQEGKIKYHLIKARMKQSRRFFDKMKTLEKDPAFYAEVAIQSLFLLIMRDYAPLENRLKSAISRMKKLPYLFDAAKKNVKNPPKIYSQVAIEMLQGATGLVQKLLPSLAQEVPTLKNEMDEATTIASVAFRDYERFVKEVLLPKSTGEFAIGKDLLDEILKEEEFLDYNSDELWEIGQRELEKCERELEEFVRKNFNTDKPWREVFREIKKNHPPADKVLKTYEEYLNKAKDFVVTHDLVTIPPNQKLIAMDTPEFNRPLIPYAAMMPPAPYEEDQTSFLWVTPVDPNQPPEDQERQLMDSSYGKIQYVSLHEAYPGHHLQLVHASKIKDDLYKRTFSNIFIEGWAFYCENMMGDMGYFDKEGKLCQLEAAYWRAMRILLDVGLHTKRFTYDSAMKFVQEKTDWSPFIIKGELNRYSRMPAQALSYYTGKLEIFKIKDKYQKKHKEFTWKGFHDTLLSFGSLPPRVIEWKMGIRPIDVNP